jgi:hypothetical protein
MLYPLFIVLGVEAATLVGSALAARRDPGAVVRRRVMCPIAARAATIHLVPSLYAGAPPALVRCSLLQAGAVPSCARSCLAAAQPLRRASSPAQLLRGEVVS